MDLLKRSRGNAKGNFTRKLNTLKDLMSNPENLSRVKLTLKELRVTFTEFKNAHNAYHNQLNDEEDKLESSLYYKSVRKQNSELEKQVESWLVELGHVKSLSESDIRPEDSISNVESQLSSRVSARSRASSSRSSISEKARATARKAALEAKAASIKNMHEIQAEELRLQQKRVQLQLQTDIAVAEAERMAYEQAEAEESFTLARDTDPLANTQARSENLRNTMKKEATNGIINHPSVIMQGHAHENRRSVPSNSQQLNPAAAEWQHQNNEQNMQTPIRASTQANVNGNLPLGPAQDIQPSVFQLLLQQQQQNVKALTLPQPSLQVFSGNPVEYCDFIRAFDYLIESKTQNPAERLYYLVQYTTGHVQELMKSCLTMRSEEGYIRAKNLLKKRFGQGYRIAAAHVDRLINGPPIKAEDSAGLQQFSILLTSCTNTLEEIGYLNKLDNPDSLRKIIERLPYGLRLRWRDIVDDIIEREDRDVTVKDIMRFVTTKARAAAHPVFGRVANEPKVKLAVTKSKQFPANTRVHSYATQGDTQSRQKRKPNCPLCDSSHWLSQCERFRKMTLSNRLKLVNEKRLCNNCLTVGHFVRSCPKDSFCKVDGCTSKHSTFLHPKVTTPISECDSENRTPVSENGNDPTSSTAVNAANNNYVKVSTKPSVKIASSTTALSILPVRVKAKDQARAIETYAFLDNGSNTSFCTDELLRKLNLKGEKTNLSLTTMQGKGTPVECSQVNLEVMDLSEENLIELPIVYSRPDLPIS